MKCISSRQTLSSDVQLIPLSHFRYFLNRPSSVITIMSNIVPIYDMLASPEYIHNTGNPATTRLDFQDFVAFKKSFGAYNRKEVKYRCILPVILVIGSKNPFESDKILKI